MVESNPLNIPKTKNMEYFIIENGQQTGPFSDNQLAAKRISPDTLVWKQGMADWTPAWQVEELKQILEDIKTMSSSQQEQKFQIPPIPPTPKIDTTQDLQPQKRGKGMLIVKGIMAIFFIALIVLALTNPSEEEHKAAIKTEVRATVDSITDGSDGSLFTQGIQIFAKAMANNLTGNILNELFEYHNYIIFSKGTVRLDDSSHTISFGILGKVYSINSDDIIKAIEGNSKIDIIQNQTSLPSDTDDNKEDYVSKGIDKKIEDKASQTLDKISNQVSKKVEEKINKKIDEVTDSSTIEKIIDKIFELF